MDFESVLTLTPDQLFCFRHGEPFRKRRPNQAIKEYCRQWLEYKEEFYQEWCGDIEKLCRLLEEKPWCCRMHPNELLTVYWRSGVGLRDDCVRCRKKRIGTPYTYRDRPGGLVKHIAHLCFECLVYRTVDRDDFRNPSNAPGT